MGGNVGGINKDFGILTGDWAVEENKKTVAYSMRTENKESWIRCH